MVDAATILLSLRRTFHCYGSSRTIIALTEKGEDLKDRLIQVCKDVESVVRAIEKQSSDKLWLALDNWEKALAEKSLLKRVQDEKFLRNKRVVEIVDYRPEYFMTFLMFYNNLMHTSMNIEDIKIRPEQESDFAVIHNIVRDAFAGAEHSDGNEQDLVERIRLTPDYIPQLSLVAVINEKIVGHLMMSKIKIGNVTAIALALLAVNPEYQRQGVGSKLINAAHNIAVEYGYSVLVVLGSPDYYSKFGYEKAKDYGVIPPFDIPAEYFMIHSLDNTSLIPAGTVTYSSAFNI